MPGEETGRGLRKALLGQPALRSLVRPSPWKWKHLRTRSLAELASHPGCLRLRELGRAVSHRALRALGRATLSKARFDLATSCPTEPPPGRMTALQDTGSVPNSAAHECEGLTEMTTTCQSLLGSPGGAAEPRVAMACRSRPSSTGTEPCAGARRWA